MRTWLKIALFAGLLLGLFGSVQAGLPAAPQGRVSDFADLLDDTTKAELEGLLTQVETKTSAELAVVTVDSLDGETVETYANQLFQKWGIGKQKQDNGVLLLVAPHERKVRIEVGYGLEKLIPDGRAGRIIAEEILPLFKAGDYPRGILRGAEQLAAILNGKAGEEPETTAGKSGHGKNDMTWKEQLIVILFLSIFVTIGMLALGAAIRTGNWFLIIWGSGFGGIPLMMGTIIGLATNLPLFILPGWGAAMFITGLVMGKKVSQGLRASSSVSVGGSGMSFSSGSSSGGFSGGSSFGGFSGGSSGGGGSSGSW